ncbi:MAG TPA: nicotinate phosphoribosyltransferase [Bryobacteraceae bacterium]|jgi:nicotinate phosphoribosyltransferase|nr:nicotinate phosphoribosyltransferase [Bryobacteraceae bacterium]
MNALLTDLYELTMAAGYFQAGKTAERAVFELAVRRLPPRRNFVLAAGLPQVVDYLLNLSFTAEEIDYLRQLPQFQNVAPAFFDYLRDFRFTGDLFAVPEGTPLFAGEPMLTLRAPIVEAQIPETYLLSALSFQSLVATKAARCVEAAGGRSVVEFGTRRAHTPEAGVFAARAAYLGGCAGTSNTLAGFRYAVPVMGTVAHSWVMAFCGEAQAFRHIQRLLGDSAVQLIDTYDTLKGARQAAQSEGPFWGVRLDSGDFVALSKQVRAILDDAGHAEAKIMVSGDLDEYRIRELLAAGAPIDAFGVGTQLSVSADAPSLSTVYKLVEIEICGIQRFTAKFSDDKPSYPGSKQIFRDVHRDVIARSGECGRGEALLRPIILGGRLLEPLPTLEQARRRAAESVANLSAPLRELEETEPWPVIHSRELRDLIDRTRRNILG